MKKGVIIVWLIFLSAGIGWLFWHNEWVYGLPTPVPTKYVDVKEGTNIQIAAKLNQANRHPLFLHFFNPDCPCSRFNMPHFKTLVKQYGTQVNFAIVVMSTKHFTQKEINQKYGLNVPVYFDSTIAKSCGVYSTPQAVIIDANNNLYYRGNYNKSRYCTNKKTNYAQMALDSLLTNRYDVVFDRFALKSYGCQLTNCYK